jgi:hypothetical protein
MGRINPAPQERSGNVIEPLDLPIAGAAVSRQAVLASNNIGEFLAG